MTMTEQQVADLRLAITVLATYLMDHEPSERPIPILANAKQALEMK